MTMALMRMVGFIVEPVNVANVWVWRIAEG